MGECLFARRGVVQTGPIVPKPVFADNTWAEIVQACWRNKVPETWAVGNQKAMTINGVEYLIDIIGKDHDTYADGSGIAPLTFQLHDLYIGMWKKMNDTDTNAPSWGSSVLRNTHLLSVMDKMPAEVQKGIKRVNKLTSAGRGSSSIKVSADKLFLLSEIEYTGIRKIAVEGEGKQYAFYQAGGSVIKAVEDTVVSHWTRSPRSQNVTDYTYVDANGDTYSSVATNSFYFAPAFCF